MLNPPHYKAHALDHPDVIIRDTAKGRGVFAGKNIPRGAVIAQFTGEVYTSARAASLPAIMVDHAMQIGPQSYVHAKGRLAEIINHSCRPNCGVSDITKIVTLYDIKAGAELCWDYAMSEMSDWRMDNCLCGAKRCRGTVGSYALLPYAVKAEYLRRGAVSDWIIQTLNVTPPGVNFAPP